jgi:hypothetical protein
MLGGIPMRILEGLSAEVGKEDVNRFVLLA